MNSSPTTTPEDMDERQATLAAAREKVLGTILTLPFLWLGMAGMWIGQSYKLPANATPAERRWKQIIDWIALLLMALNIPWFWLVGAFLLKLADEGW